MQKEQETPIPEEVATPPVEELPVEPAPSEEPPVEVKPGEEPAPPAEEPPAFEPNYMFKIHGQEKEFDDWAKDLVKDKESEEMFRDIMTKVHGIDHIKEDREALRTQVTELSKIQQEHNALNQSLDELSHYVNTGNLQMFFNKVGIGKEQLLNYYQQLVQYEEMTPEQRMAHDRSIQADAENYQLRMQNQQLTFEQQQVAHTQRMQELDLYMSRPDLAGTIQEFDARMGRQGAFKEHVVNYGVSQQTIGKDVSVTDAVNHVINLIGGVPASPQAPAATPGAIPTPQAQPPQPMAVEKKPVIPVVPSSGKTPVKAGISSIEDLKKARAAKFGN